MSPYDLGGHTCGLEPGDLLVKLAGVVNLGIDMGHDVRRVDWVDYIPEDEASSRSKDTSDPSEEISLAVAFEMVHGESRHDEVESAIRQRILESPDDQRGATRRQATRRPAASCSRLCRRTGPNHRAMDSASNAWSR